MKRNLFNSIGLGKKTIWKVILPVLLVSAMLASSIVTAIPVLAVSSNITSTGSGNWSATAWPNTARTGTITTSTSSKSVTGVGTAFTTEISVGNIVKTTGDVAIGTVASVTDDTHLTLNSSAASTNNGIAYHSQGVGSGDNVTIANNNIVTVDVAAAFCSSLTLADATSGNNGVTVSATNSLTVASAISFTYPSGSSGSVTSQINVGAGSVTAGSVTDTSTNTSQRWTGFEITTGSLTVTGNYAGTSTTYTGERIDLTGQEP